MSFANKIVLVTGAACGIGAEIALKFAEQSATLVLIDILDEELKNTAKKCTKFSAIVKTITVNITKDEEVRNIIKETLKEFKKIDVLINNAGKFVGGGILDENLMITFDTLYSVNLRSSVLLSHLVVPELIKTKGCIVNISSVAARTPHVDMLAYVSMKAAITHFTKSMALELADKGVRVNCISPGPVRTSLLKHAGVSEDDVQKKWDTFISFIPTNSEICIEDVAKLAVYLASDDAKCMTGGDYLIDSGYVLGKNN